MTTSPTQAAPPPYALPPLGDNPSTAAQGTSPGSFAKRGAVGTPWTFSSPDAPGMPAPSDKTAWDFMPPDWVCVDPAARQTAALGTDYLTAAGLEISGEAPRAALHLRSGASRPLLRPPTRSARLARVR